MTTPLRERTPQQWRDVGYARLVQQAQRVQPYIAYYDGDFPLRGLVQGEDRAVFRRLLKEARANWCELVVNAVAERLFVVGFGFGDSGLDELAWTLWQANSMDADHEMSQTDALVCGQAFALVQPDEQSPVGVSITPEHASQVTVVYEPGSRRRRAAAVKAWLEPEGDGTTEYVALQTPQANYLWARPSLGAPPDLVLVDETPNRLGAVGFVELTPAPRTVGAPRSELHSATSIQDRINTTIFNRLVATDYGAFRQIYATGLKLSRTPDGRPAKPFDVGANRLLVNENPDGRFGVFAESTLAGYLNGIEADVQHLAAITQTPPHYLLGRIVNASGDALKAAETGLVAKVRRRAAHLGEGWEEVMRLALSAVGSAGTVDFASEVLWRDFESRSEGELVDALTKMHALGVPREVLWKRWGASPQEIPRWREMYREQRLADAAFDAALATRFPADGQPADGIVITGGNAA